MNESMTSHAAASEATELQTPPLLYEMIRSFVALSRTLNLSHAVSELNSTRQTVRRHISLLEEMKGEALFSIEDRRYQLTVAGSEVLPEAENILARCNVWARGQMRHCDGMPQINMVLPNGGEFFQQQKPLSTIWQSDRPLLSATLKAWTLSEGRLESEHFQNVRPYAMVYRNSLNGWVCVELGEQSSYVSWYGMANARSSVGRVLGELPGGRDLGRLLSFPFFDVERERNARVDHIYTQIPRGPENKLEQICYVRLLLGCSFPDGSFALVSMIDRHNDIDILGTPGHKMPPELVMKLEPILLNQEH